MWLILGRVFTLHSYVPASLASVALITNVQSSARIRGLKQYCQNILCSKATIGGYELVCVICNLMALSELFSKQLQPIFAKVLKFQRSLLNIWVSLFLWRLSFPDSISREGQQLKKSICNVQCRINFLWWVDKAVKSVRDFHPQDVI